MKKINLSSLIFLLIFIGCANESKNKTEKDVLKHPNDSVENNSQVSNVLIMSKKDSADYIVKCYDDFFSKKDSLSEVTFFNFFPDKFNTFNGLYGYTEEHDMPLSKYGEKHIIEYYENRKYITNKEYYTKLFNICKNGKWYADGVGFIQHIVQTELNKNPQEAMDIISKFTKTEKEGFWFFYFDGPIQDKENLKQLENILPKQEILIAKEAFNNVVKHYE